MSKTQTLSVVPILLSVGPHCHGHAIFMPGNETLTFLLMVNG